MSSEKDKMIAGELYRPGDAELCADRARAQKLTRKYNSTIVGEDAKRAPILDALLGSYGEGTAIRAPFYVDYGYNIHLGRDIFFNYGCVLLDVCPITIGDMTQIGPMVQILAADHPRAAADRDAGLENGNPVTIGRNVWIGGGALILPGVTVGDDAIIGAGAAVTRDVAPGATVAGNPARPLPVRPGP
ncbi:MAG: sugar O-acetyltransferase [Alphaproteobacteria bacterium]|nr:sugar O-acetyltransferase [Alphaproteobacteria bacterium]NNF23936.1 sugar O-acetyltransferase [Paracoccaceae bacterium]